jgi:hypothetical protein
MWRKASAEPACARAERSQRRRRPRATSPAPAEPQPRPSPRTLRRVLPRVQNAACEGATNRGQPASQPARSGTLASHSTRGRAGAKHASCPANASLASSSLSKFTGTWKHCQRRRRHRRRRRDEPMTARPHLLDLRPRRVTHAEERGGTRLCGSVISARFPRRSLRDSARPPHRARAPSRRCRPCSRPVRAPPSGPWRRCRRLRVQVSACRPPPPEGTNDRPVGPNSGSGGHVAWLL